MTSSIGLIGAGTLGNVIDPLDAEGLKLGALEITEDRYSNRIRILKGENKGE